MKRKKCKNITEEKEKLKEKIETLMQNVVFKNCSSFRGVPREGEGERGREREREKEKKIDL